MRCRSRRARVWAIACRAGTVVCIAVRIAKVAAGAAVARAACTRGARGRRALFCASRGAAAAAVVAGPCLLAGGGAAAVVVQKQFGGCSVEIELIGGIELREDPLNLDLAVGGEVIKCRYPLNVIKRTYDHSCYERVQTNISA